MTVATRTKMLDILKSERRVQLQLEMAAIVDGGLPFVQATYNLEGDGPMVLHCFKELSTVNWAIQVANFPNLNRIAQSLAQENLTVEQQMVGYGITCIKPAHDYFSSKFNGDLKPALAAFKAAQLFCPHEVHDSKPNASLVEIVKAFPFLNDTVIDNLKAELPKYLAAVEDLAPDIDPLDWWKQHSNDLPHWSSAANACTTIFSSAREGIFSAKQYYKQDSALQDYIETSLMLPYNRC